MASITIRNLDDEIKQRLRVRAAERGHSMEEEARDILRRVTSEGSAPRNLAAAIRARLAPADRFDLALPAREPMREPPQFTSGRRRTALTKAIEGTLDEDFRGRILPFDSAAAKA